MNQPSFYSRPRWRARMRSFLAAGFLFNTVLFASVTHASSALTISGTPATTVTAGSSYSFTPTVKDTLTGRTLSFAIVDKPSWASFSSTTGKLSGTPGATNVGKYSNIVIAVYDGINAAVLSSFSITVLASGSTVPTGTGALTISGTPATTITAGSSYSFTPTVKDTLTGRTLSFAIVYKPSWATFSSTTGKLSGTPSSANVGKYSNIGIAVYDGVNAAVLPSFSVTVQASGTTTSSSTVTISGTPVTSVVAGNAYRFQPTASDSAGRTVSFSVSNKPSWATFSISSGLLSGTPTSTQTGSYPNIVISASDGLSSSALPAFTLTVSGATVSTGSATLGWTDPTQNTNGTTLTNLAGIHIYYGTSASALTHMLTIASPSQNSYTLGGLAAGTWYFAATAYTTTGAESALSRIGSKTIP